MPWRSPALSCHLSPLGFNYSPPPPPTLRLQSFTSHSSLCLYYYLAFFCGYTLAVSTSSTLGSQMHGIQQELYGGGEESRPLSKRLQLFYYQACHFVNLCFLSPAQLVQKKAKTTWFSQQMAAWNYQRNTEPACRKGAKILHKPQLSLSWRGKLLIHTSSVAEERVKEKYSHPSNSNSPPEWEFVLGLNAVPLKEDFHKTFRVKLADWWGPWKP